MTWSSIAAIASPAIALTSLFFSSRSTITARKSLTLANRSAQSNFEAAKAAAAAPVDLFLEEVQYRKPTARNLNSFLGYEAKKWAADYDSDCLEVVLRGRLVNRRPVEILVNCTDHEWSDRNVIYSHRNHSVFIIDGVEAELGRFVLLPEQEVRLEWIDRRPRGDWINIHNLYNRNLFGDRELRLPRLKTRTAMRAILRREDLAWTKQRQVSRSGFRIVCEPRVTERVAAIWDAEIVKTPVEVEGRDEGGRISFQESLNTIKGPIDDTVVHYRVRFDASLAQINSPRLREIPGRP